MATTNGETPPFDFTEALQRAAEQAPIITPATGEKSTDLAFDEQLINYFRHRSDIYIGYVRDDKEEPEHEILTDTLLAYAKLVEQALRTFRSEDFPDDETLVASAKRVVAHEEEHGAAIRTVGRNIPIRYGIGIVRYQLDDGQLKPDVTHPFTSFAGCLRKIDWAFIIAAPTDPSDSDLELIHGLGYEDPEEVKTRRANLPTGRFTKPELARLGARVLDWRSRPPWQRH
jgi:hypothetical protein